MSRAPLDTIAAVSTPPGRSWRGLIRLSGPEALDATRALLAEPIDVAASHTLQPVRLADPPIPALLVLLRAPHSYTGQDMAELQVPGNAALLERLSHRLIATPGRHVRLAEPGEFTFRAYVNGRMDLTRAEGVAATISAECDAQLGAATMLRAGRLAELARSFVDDLGQALALVEAGIDFVDQEDVVPITAAALRERLGALGASIAALRQRSRSWREVESLPRVVMVGPPSSGKSTLFNALLGAERAVIHDLPGTTRDELAEPLRLTGERGEAIDVMLVDIAGLDAAEVLLDREAQAAARRAIDRADVLLCLGEPPAEDSGGRCLRIEARADIVPPTGAGLAVSAVTGLNLDALRRLIAEAIGARGVNAAGDALALQPRHEQALSAVADHLAVAADLLAGERGEALAAPELIAGAMREALDAMASLGGEMTPDDVIGKVFASFCVGK